MNETSFQLLLADCVDFAQRLIQTPSMPEHETQITQLIKNEMQQLAFDEIIIDEVGNVSGVIFGRDRELGALVLNSHLDHVDPGDPRLWLEPPYAAVIKDDHILGRGACDIKGPLAVQIYSMAGLLRMSERPKRDVVFTGVVEEEIGGRGAKFWTDNLDYDVSLIILGEPSSNRISLGHRGILQIWVTFSGRSVHASVPARGVNPNYSLAVFLQRLNQLKDDLKEHPILGPTTVAPTVIEVDTTSLNVTPAWSRVLLDFRTSTESINSIKQFIAEVAGDLECELSDAWASKADTPLPDSDEIIHGFYTPPDEPVVQEVRELVSRAIGREVELGSYQFATDGRHFISSGADIIGYSAGEEKFAHTVDERISISMMAESLKGHLEILRRF